MRSMGSMSVGVALTAVMLMTVFLSTAARRKGNTCHFDTPGMCSWYADMTKGAQWRRLSGKENNATFGPFADHTLQVDQGSFLFLQKTSKQKCYSGELLKRNIKIPRKGMCFSFWYFMNGVDEDISLSLEVNYMGSVNHSFLLNGGSHPSVSWHKKGPQGPDWRFAQFQIPGTFTSHCQVIPAFSVCSRGEPSMALDDMSFTTGTCPMDYHCDFDDDLCGYQQSSGSDLEWLVGGSDKKDDRSDRIQKNYSPENLEANYIFLNFSSLSIAGDTSVILSPEFEAKASVCFRFWFKIRGSVNLELSQTIEGRQDKSLWSIDGDGLAEWQLATIDVHSDQKYRLSLNAMVGNETDEDLWLSLDSIDTTQGHCHHTCDFEDAACPWRRDSRRSLSNWLRVSAGKESNKRMVRFDHTLGTKYGKYLLLNGSHTDDGDVTARLISVSLAPKKQFCLSFWYAIEKHGHINIKYLTESSSDPVIFNISSPSAQSKEWAYFKENIPELKYRSRIVIEGVINQANGDRVYLDDLLLQESQCGESEITSRNMFQCADGGARLSVEKICDFHPDCPGGDDETSCGYDCTFEEGNCKWKSLSNNNHFWNTTSAKQLNGTLGPTSDHTLGRNTGKFIHAIVVDTYRSHHHEIISPSLRRSTDKCQITFFVYVTDPNAWILKVKNIAGDRIQTRYGSYKFEANTWTKITASIGYNFNPFHVQIEARSRLKYTQAAIALDDISFINCDFLMPDSASSIDDSGDNFQCGNGIVVPSSKVCDTVNDCLDASDETNEICQDYLRCSFDVDLCNWTQEKEMDYVDWSRQQANGQRYPYVGPEYDHTTQSSAGSVLEMVGWNGKAGDKARILSPVLMPSVNCTLKLYLFLQSNRQDVFNVYTRHGLTGPLTFHTSMTGESGRFWAFKSLTFSSSSPFQIILEGIRGYGWYVEIAVDDISLSPECRRGQWEHTTTTLQEVTTVAPPRLNQSSTPHPPREATSTLSNGCKSPDAWQCLDKSLCIHNTQRCDFRPQCDDRSDELDCGSCDFENSTCGWTDMSKSSDMYVWIQHNPTLEMESLNDTDIVTSLSVESAFNVSGDPSTNETVDIEFHLNDTASDREEANGYMLARKSGQVFNAKNAVLVSPVFGATSSSCTVTFQYKASVSGSLSLYLHTGDSTSYKDSDDDKILWRSITDSEEWLKATVGVESLASGFRLVFKSRYISFKPSAIVGIDDVAFGPLCGDDSRWTLCRGNEFSCRNSTVCLSNHDRCDLVKDCPHGDDEQGCDPFKLGSVDTRNIFSHDETGDFKWLFQKARRKDNPPMPPSDNSGILGKGRYLYLNASGDMDKNKDRQRAIAISYSMHPSSKGNCFLRFFYWNAGDRFGLVDIYTVNMEGIETMLWSMTNEKVEDWTKVVLPLKATTKFGIILRGIRYRNYRGGIAIDDVSISPECYYDNRYQFKLRKVQKRARHSKRHQYRLKPCGYDFIDKSRPVHKSAMCSANCTFDNGMCGWTQKNRKKSVPWTIESLRNVSRWDPTVENLQHEHVLLVGSSAGKDGKRPKLLHSPLITNTDKGCTFSFRYYFVGRVSIFYISMRTQRDMERLYYDGPQWDKRKGQSGRWNTLSVAIPPRTGEFRLVIYLFMETRAVTNSFFMMDNFTFSDCFTPAPPKLCPVGHALCENGHCVSEDQLCDLENDCWDWSDESDERCAHHHKFTFENGLMGWKRDASTQYKWTVRKGWKKNGRYNFGRPPRDHTTYFKDGHYLSTTGQIGKEKKASIIYEMNPLSEPCRVIFWYQMSCVDQQSCVINVYTKTMFGSKIPLQKFTSQSLALRWEKASFTMMINESFHIIIEGILDGQQFSTLNIDDIIFSPNCIKHQQQKGQETSGELSQNSEPNYVPCNQSGAFHCARRNKCISGKQACDFNDDCGDGSDERGCHTNTVCEFDNDVCNWWFVKLPSFGWKTTRSFSERKFPIPPVSGNYIFLELSEDARKVRGVSDLYSRRFNSAGPACKIRFQFYISGSQQGESSITLNLHDDRSILGPLWKTHQSTDRWQEAVVGIGKRQMPFSMFFRANTKSKSTIYFALDKIRYENCTTVTIDKNICPNSHYQCGSGGCLPDTYVCNGQNDCTDGSDEDVEMCRGIVVMNFEDHNPLHLLSKDRNDTLSWKVWDRHQPLPVGLSAIDHTTWSNKGHFLVLVGQPGTTREDTASIITRTYLSPDKTCTIRFNAIIPTENQSVVISYMADESGATTMATLDGPVRYGTFWQTLAVVLGVDFPFRLAITGMVGGPDGALAVDDVIFGSDCNMAR